MKRILVLTIVAVALVGSAVQAADKVRVCHRAPGDPNIPDHAEATGWHTITVTENNVASHLAHGDLPGSCNESCDILCGDGDACTVDHNNDCEENGCLTTSEPVDCNDSLLCTADSCDPAAGCQYAPIVCDDGNACTTDTCNPVDGQCLALDVDCGALGLCVPETGLCDYPCDGISCDPIDQCHEAGTCVLPGECVDGDPVADGTTCDDGDPDTYGDQCTQGVCSGTPDPDFCPCDFSFANLDCVLGTTNLNCSGAGTNPSHLLVFGSGNSCDGTSYTNQSAIVEFVPVWNWDLGGLENDPSFWPVCGVGEFFEAPPLTEHQIGLTATQADACYDQLLDWILDRGVCS